VADRTGTLLNERYRLDAELGRGGMGMVYRAHDTFLERDVAVKILSEADWGTEGRARLIHEARAAASLNHPNVVSVHDAGEAEGAPYTVMEFVEGPSLHERRPTSLDETLNVAQQVCAALEHAHAQGVIHRDLKPENVLLAPDPPKGAGRIAKLTDFGLARSVASRLTSDGTIVGTVFYLAPELALGQDFNGRADLYALGVMLYELTTGRLPFEADDPVAVIGQHLHAPVVPPQAKNPEIPADLSQLIVRLLSKAPEDRPSTAGEVREALQALASGEAMPSAPAEGMERVSMLDRIVRGRIVGREAELQEARALWRKTTAGEGQTLLVSGEPGIGKTRLVRELVTQVQISGDTALVGECYSEGGAPYAPFAQIVRRTFQDGTGDGLRLPDFVLADLLTFAPTLRLRFPDVQPNPSLDPESEQMRLFENIVAFCQALSNRAPLLLVLEDAHWADSGTLDLLRHLARRTRRQRVLLVATYREVELDEMRPLREVLLDLNRERLATRLKLSRLDSEGTRDMLAALFDDEITPEFLEGIYQETEGNPFFIEEVCKALVESGQVFVVEGGWDRQSMEEMEIPQSVRVAIQSRVGRLSPDVQETLRLAAIVGREFDFDTLVEASDQDEDALIDALEIAEGSQLVQEVSGERGVTFAFTHALFPTTLVEGVRTLRRRRLHRRAAAAIERLCPDDYEALAHHYGEAGDEERALVCHTRAGERASAAYANQEAERHFLAALDLVDSQADEGHLLAELGRVQARQSRFEEAIGTWREGIEILKALGDQDGVAELYARSARAAWDAGDTPRGLALCREGMAVVAGAADSPEVANLLHETARACLFNGLPDEAASLGYQSLEMAERLDAVAVQAEALTTLGTIPGRPTEELVCALTRAVELAESAGLLAQADRAHNNLAEILSEYAGDFTAARVHHTRAVELSRKRGAVAQEIFYLASATRYASLQGAIVEVEKVLPSLRQLMDATHDPGPAAYLVQGVEATVLRFRGDLAEAIGRLQAIRRESREVGDLQVLMNTCSYVAEVLIEAGREEEAEAAAQEAIDLVGRFAPGLTVLPTGLLAMIRVRQGAYAKARRLLDEAHEATRGGWADVLLLWAEAQLMAAEARWPEVLAAFEAAADAMKRIGVRWYRARVLQDWAEAHLSRNEAGDLGRAQGLLQEAMTEFEDMGVPFYAAQVREQLEDLGRG
jgi:tetratricopeptide (TPR) repeat protein